jgi:DNA-binding transcriptional LysR family regulator
VAVDPRRLQAFVAVAHHGTFGRAAEELHLTQSALSQQVRKLEDELGVVLLRRTSTGAEPTPAGADLLPRAEAILAQVAQTRARMDEYAGVERGAVRVACAPGDALTLAPALAAFHREHPGLQVALRQAPAVEVAALVATDSVDLALAEAASAPAGTDVAPLPDDPLWIVLAPDDPLAADGDVALWDLRDRPFVLPERGSALRETVVAGCQAAGFSPVPRFEVGDPATVRFLVGAGLGVAVLPGAWLAIPGPAVARARPREPLAAHRLALVHRGAAASPAARLLAERLAGELASS